MIDVALTGSRFSGKDTVAKLIEKQGIPVFNSDVILKFLISTSTEITKQLNSIETINDSKFDEILDLVEFALFKSFNDFKDANKSSNIVVFHSSLIFERNWQHNFNYVINVYCPLRERVNRMVNKFKIGDDAHIKKILESEISEFVKSGKSDFVYMNSDDSLKVSQEEKLKNFLNGLK